MMDCMRIIVAGCGVVGTVLSLLRLRLLPRILMKAWFVLTLMMIVVPACAALYLIDPIRYVGVPRTVTQWLCMHFMMYSFTWVTRLNPQTRIDVRFDDPRENSPRSWADIPTHGCAYCLNHVSMWDILHVITVVPRSHLVSIRTLMKHTLRNVPIFGGCFDRVGHFPVYFTRNVGECFTVDKEKQAKVQLDVEKHIQRGGNVAFFPEGAMNKTPTELLPFRYGTFETIFRHRMPVYYMVTVNNDKAWPRGEMLGGNPVNTRSRIGSFPIDYDAGKSTRELVGELRDYMQKMYDELRAELEAEGKLLGRGFSVFPSGLVVIHRIRYQLLFLFLLLLYLLKLETIMDAFQTIRNQVAREATRLATAADDAKAQHDVLGLLAESATREAVLDVALRIMQEEEDNRREMGYFLLYYLPGLSYSRKSLERILEVLTKVTELSAPSQKIMEALKHVIEGLLPYRTSAGVRKGGVGMLSSQPWCQAPGHSSSFPHTSFRASTPQPQQEPEASFVSVTLISDEDVVRLAHQRNQNSVLQRKDIPLYLRPGAERGSLAPRYNDYIHQCPLTCSEGDAEKYIRVLRQLWDRYRTNPIVLRASSFLFKQMCDGMVSKIPFGPPYTTSFRSISMCFLPTMLEWMEADYLCIRHHVYDFLVTFGAHLQMLDSQSSCPGVAQALQGELVWLTLNVLQRQILVIPYDEMTWTAAAKCILAVLPRSERSWIDGRVFVQIMRITGLAELHPDTYGSFAEAFVLSLLQPPGRKRGYDGGGTFPASSQAHPSSNLSKGGVVKDEDKMNNTPPTAGGGGGKEDSHHPRGHSRYIFSVPNTLDEEEFAKLGKGAVSYILGLYRSAYTVGGRLWLFKLVFVLAAERLRLAEGFEAIESVEQRTSEECFVTYGFFWYYHELLFFTAQHLRVEVLKKFSMSHNSHTEYTQSIHSKLLDLFIGMAEEDAELPESLLQRLPRIPQGPSQESFPANIEILLRDVMEAARMLLKTDNGGVANGGPHNIAWRLLLFCLEAIRSLGTGMAQERVRLLNYFINSFVVCTEDTDHSDISRIRRVLPDLLASLFIQWRTSPHAGVSDLGGKGGPSTFTASVVASSSNDDEILGAIVEAYLFTDIRPLTHRLLALYYHLFELFVEFEGTLFHPEVPESTDLSFLLMDSVAVLEMPAMESLGVRLFWSLFKGLSSEMALSACRARQVLISLLSQFRPVSPASPFVWKCAMEDGYPPVSLIGAKVVMERWKYFESNAGGTEVPEFACIWQSLNAVAMALAKAPP
eukprot:gene9321-6558_t